MDPLQQIVACLEEIKLACADGITAVPPLATSGREPSLPRLSTLSAPLIARHNPRISARLNAEIQITAERLREVINATYRQNVAATSSLASLGGPSDEEVEERLCRVYEQVYERQLSELQRRVHDSLQTDVCKAPAAVHLSPFSDVRHVSNLTMY